MRFKSLINVDLALANHIGLVLPLFQSHTMSTVAFALTTKRLFQRIDSIDVHHPQKRLVSLDETAHRDSPGSSPLP